MSKTVTISEADDGQRLDRWLKTKYPSIPYTFMQKALRKGEIKLEGKRVEGNARLNAGQQLRLPPALLNADKPGAQARISKRDEQQLQDMLIYEDKSILVFNKPYGLATQGGSKTARHLDDLLRAYAKNEDDKPKLVHRLDKETSGVIVVAKTRAVAERMGEIFKYREAKKTYLAITVDVPRRREGYIKAPLIKDGDRIVVDKENGKDAKTHYKTLTHSDRDIALVALRPETGRMHQLRAHLAYIYTPILGDKKYDGVVDEYHFAHDAAKERMWLHALCLTFPHPVSGKVMTFSAPVPKPMQKWLEEWHMDVEGVTDTKKPEDPMQDIA